MTHWHALVLYSVATDALASLPLDLQPRLLPSASASPTFQSALGRLLHVVSGVCMPYLRSSQPYPSSRFPALLTPARGQIVPCI
ncbi:hypothetical protein PENSPDRAFT_646987 [Peniophora sp. CONT]|nr:hypothetical protein PENSPDRAFT_646987 [Peniophora sp. CONT]